MNQVVAMRWMSFFLLLLAHGTAASTQGISGLRRRSADGNVAYEIFSEAPAKPILVLLHGASGPDLLLYRDQARMFAERGFMVVLPHYFDATEGSTAPSDANYEAWASVVRSLVTEFKGTGTTPRSIFLVGYSLGASVALAAGSEGLAVAAVVEWYGSLPDSFFYRMRGMPPLLILHGERDRNIPVENAKQLVRLCRMR